jgi:hypothetical protein
MNILKPRDEMLCSSATRVAFSIAAHNCLLPFEPILIAPRLFLSDIDANREVLIFGHHNMPDTIGLGRPGLVSPNTNRARPVWQIAFFRHHYPEGQLYPQ